MHVLHIANDYAGSKVHSNLMSKLNELGLEQTIYCPIRDPSLKGKNCFSNNVKIIYSFCIKKWYKFLYHYKIKKLYQDLKQNVELRSIDFVHAHTLFSDGALAYELYKEFGIKYSIAVRNTDLNLFIRLMKHTHQTGRKILVNAEKIYFISPAIMKGLAKSSFAKPILNIVKEKFELRPNGIDEFWLNNITREERRGHDILYIGVFDKNKNVGRLAEAILQLRQEKGFEDTRLVLVGGDADDDYRKSDKNLKHLISDNPSSIITKGRIFDKNQLMDIMHNCSVFAMPSIYETFGLVYIESLSQNLPIVYTKGQGVDGMFDDSVGISVNPLSIEDIKKAIKAILSNRKNYGNNTVEFEKFNWRRIAQKYLEDYSKISNS